MSKKLQEDRSFPEIIKFIRTKDYSFVKKLGQGACGVTILVNDCIINEQFVCKKYVPFDNNYRENLYKRFLDEIKILHTVSHRNIVRVFNYYLYPTSFSGYILMEYINGETIDRYIVNHPQNINEIFEQTIEAFAYLEERKLLHRDIRMSNIMVTNSGVVKVIDFGFSKKIEVSGDSDKSVSLNWWCELPNEFSENKYNSTTEVYFVGKLFEKILQENNIENFNYKKETYLMCQRDATKRVQSFAEILQSIHNNLFLEIDFDIYEKQDYRKFSEALAKSINSIERKARFEKDIDNIQGALEELYKQTMLENIIPDTAAVPRCFIKGSYYFSSSYKFEVEILKNFVKLLKTSPNEKKNIILNNLIFKLDNITKYDEMDDDIPF